VFGDGVKFDAATGALRRGASVVASPERLHARFSERAAVYELVTGYSLGTGLRTTWMFVMGFIGIPYGVLGISAVPVVVSIVLGYRLARFPEGPGPRTPGAGGIRG